MGIKRIVDTSFWTDGQVEDFSPEDKYFMLFLMTNPNTTQLGIYEFSIKNAAYHLGYSREAVSVLLDRFESVYGLIIYSPETKEIAIKNYLRHSIVKGGAPVRDCLVKEIKNVKDQRLITKVFSHLKKYEGLNDTVRRVIDEYEVKNGDVHYHNESMTDIDIDNDHVNDIDNDNDHEVSYHDTSTNRSKPKKKKEPTIYYPLDERLNLAFTDYVEMRKQIKKPMTSKAIDLAMKKLEELSKGDNDVAVQILDQSVLNSWQGLFPLKEEKQQTKKADDFMDMWRNA